MIFNFFRLFFLFFCTIGISWGIAQERLLSVEVAFKDSLNNIDSIPKKWGEVLKENFEHLLPPVNSKFLGLEIPVFIYNLGDSNPEKTSLKWIQEDTSGLFYATFGKRGNARLSSYYIYWNKLLRSFGEAPIYYNPEIVNWGKENLYHYFFKKGFFNVAVFPKTKKEEKDINLIYEILLGEPFKIDSLNFSSEKEIFRNTLSQISFEAPLKVGDFFSEERLNLMRLDIIYHLKNQGYYFANNNWISIVIDTLNRYPKKTLGLYFSVNPPTNPKDSSMEEIYTLKEIKFYLNQKTDSKAEKINYRGIDFYFYDQKKYPVDALWRCILLKKGGIYRYKDEQLSLQNLYELGFFQNPEIHFVKDSLEKNTLQIKIFLTEQSPYSLSSSFEWLFISNYRSFNVGVNLYKNNLLSLLDQSGLSIHYRDKNFSQGEKSQLFLSYGASFISRMPSSWDLLPFNETYENGVYWTDFKIELNRTFISGVLKNDFSLTWSKEQRLNKNFVLRGTLFDFLFSKNVDRQQSLNNTLNYYYLRLRDSLFIGQNENYTFNKEKWAHWQNYDPSLSKSVRDQREYISSDLKRIDLLLTDNLIAASRLSFFWNWKTQNTFFLSGFIESSGWFFWFFRNRMKNYGKEELSTGPFIQKEFLGIPYAEYFKTQLEWKMFLPFFKNFKFLFRGTSGLIVPYGNSQVAPFYRKFFGGGSRDNRAWIPYTMGPGATPVYDYTSNTLSSGDIKIFTSIEGLFPLYKALEGSLFLDAGNIWNLPNDRIKNQQNFFRWETFIQELGIGLGTGIRYNLKVFSIRADIAWKVYDPGLLYQHKPWIDWSKSWADFTLNVGLDYPF